MASVNENSQTICPEYCIRPFKVHKVGVFFHATEIYYYNKDNYYYYYDAFLPSGIEAEEKKP